MNRASTVGDVMDALVADGFVRVSGWGIFSVVAIAGRPGVNPGTGEPVELAPTHRICFRPFVGFRTRIREARESAASERPPAGRFRGVSAPISAAAGTPGEMVRSRIAADP